MDAVETQIPDDYFPQLRPDGHGNNLCTHAGCPVPVTPELLHLGTGLCTTHQDSFDGMIEARFPGRRRKFRTPPDLWTRACAYFEDCKRDKIPLTTSGLSLALGTSWKVLKSYQAGAYGPAFGEVMDLLLQTVEQYAETGLYGDHWSGAKFHLMRFGWSEKADANVNAPGALTVAPLVYLPHNGRDSVETVPDPALASASPTKSSQPVESAVGGVPT